PETLAQLDGLRVSARMRNAFIKRWDAEKRRAPVTLSESELHALYVRGKMSVDDVRARLLVRGLDQANVLTLQTLWDGERLARLTRFTDAEIKQLIRAKTIDQPEAVGILVGRGLSGESATKLAATWFRGRVRARPPAAP